MRRRTHNGPATIRWTFEELGSNMGCALEAELSLDVEMPEPQTWDYPGSPGGVEVVGARVTQFSSSTHAVSRAELGGWALLLDVLALKLAISKRYEIQEQYGSDLVSEDEAARDAYYERKRDELRGC